MTTRDDAMAQEPKDDARTQAPTAGHRVLMTLRVSRDSGRTWSQLTEVREDEKAKTPDNPGRFPPCTCPRCDAALRNESQCQLPVHEGSDHYGFLDDLEYGTALWLRWDGRTEVRLVVLPDCTVVGPRPDEEGCCLFADHAEAHTWEDTTEETESTDAHDA